MDKILKILNRLNVAYVKQRLLLIYLIIQNTILSLLMLIFANVIISNGQANGELDYSQIRMFYNIAIIIPFIIVYIFSPILLSRVINSLYKRNVIEHLLSVRIEISDIVYAIYFRGLATLLIILVSSFPIITISFYFGGFGLIKMLKLLLMVLSFAVFFSSVCLFISTRFVDENATTIVSYVLGAILTFVNIFYLNSIINSSLLIIPYIAFNIIMALVFVSLSKKTALFCA